MKIAIAQIRSFKGDISCNIDLHKRFIRQAIAKNADAVFFPELSLTGYEPELAKDLATGGDDARFYEFQKISDKDKITIGIGMPVIAADGIRISMVIFQPGQPMQIYSKQQLHSDELPYFVNGDAQIILEVGNKKIAPAICYESLQPTHSEAAHALGAEIYVASVAKSQKGIDRALKHYPAVAKKYNMPVLMSNCTGYCDNFESAGTSSVWNDQGVLVGQLGALIEGLIVLDTDTQEAIGIVM